MARRGVPTQLLVAVLVFATPLEGFSILTRLMGGISMPRILGYLILPLIALDLQKILARQRAAFWLWFAAFAVGSWITLANTILGPGALPPSDVGTLWQNLGLMAIVTWGASTEAGMLRTVWAFVLGLFVVVAAFALFYVTGYSVTESASRVQGVAGFQTNVAAYSALLLILLGVGTREWWSSRRRRFLVFAAIPVAGYTILLTSSRSAVAALGAGTAAYLFPLIRQAGRFSRLRAAGALAGAGLIVFLMAGETRVSSLVGRQQSRWSEVRGDAADSDIRTELREACLQLARANPMGYGVGMTAGKIAAILPNFKKAQIDAHNEYLRTLLEAGLLGFVLYAAGHVLLLVGAARSCRRLRTMWPLALLVAMQLSFYFHSNGYQKPTWIALGLIGATTMLAHRPGPRAPRKPPGPVERPAHAG